jgi:hypothetical protein
MQQHLLLPPQPLQWGVGLRSLVPNERSLAAAGQSQICIKSASKLSEPSCGLQAKLALVHPTSLGNGASGHVGGRSSHNSGLHDQGLSSHNGLDWLCSYHWKWQWHGLNGLSSNDSLHLHGLCGNDGLGLHDLHCLHWLGLGGHNGCGHGVGCGGDNWDGVGHRHCMSRKNSRRKQQREGKAAGVGARYRVLTELQKGGKLDAADMGGHTCWSRCLARYM